jgi:hypothetical protein
MERHFTHGFYLRAVYTTQNKERISTPPLPKRLKQHDNEIVSRCYFRPNCIEIQAILVRFPTVSSPEYPSEYRLLFIPGEATGT